MSLIILNVDEVRRTLSASGGAFVVYDKEVDIVRFAINSGFADIVLDGQVALRVMYQRPGETEVRAQTLTYYDTDGLHNYYDWHLAQSDLAKNGSLMVALCILDISGGEVSEWHTTPCAVRVLSTIHTDDSDEGDAEVTPTVKERVAVLESMIQRVASGAPIVVASTSAMTNTNQIYVLSTDGMWYYHNGTTWVSGGTYGAVLTDATLTQSGIPADAKATGDAINEVKADLGYYEDIAMSRSHNILPYESTSVVVNNVNVGYRNGKITINGTANNSGGRLTKIVELTLSAGEYSWYYSVSTLTGVYIERTSDNTLIPTETVSGRFKKFTLTEETTVYVGVGVADGKSYNETIDIIISDDTTKLYWLAPVQSAKDDVARTKIDEILSDPYYVKATSMTLEWEVGGIASNGNYNTNTNRLRTKYIIPVPLKMAVSGNYRFVCAQYDKKLNFIANYPSAYVAEVLPSNLNPSTAYIRFVLKRTDDASIGISEGNNLIATGIEEDNINTKKDISLAIYGDSISTYAGWIPSGNRVEYSGSIHGITNVNQTWWKKVVDYFGYNLVMNNSWSGRCVSTIRDTESGNLNSGGCEQANIDVIGSNGTPDIIIVEMGTNDINRANILGLGVWSGNPVGNVSDDNVEDADLTSFSECYARMIYRIHKTYPEAIVYCCTIMPQKRASINGWAQITQDNKTLEIWNSKIKEIADISGCRIIDFAVCGNTYINADIVFGDGATHPNGVGFLNMFDIAKKALSN